jgi:hypothetical protein
VSKRKRKSRADMAPDELKRLREAEANRQRKRREPKQADRRKHISMPYAATQAKVNRPVAVVTSELNEFIDELLTLPLAEASYALALWERETKQRLKLDGPQIKSDMTSQEAAEYHLQKKRADRFALISCFASDALTRHAARGRNRRFQQAEVERAESMGIDVLTLRKRKRAANRKAAIAKKDAAVLAAIRQNAISD